MYAFTIAVLAVSALAAPAPQALSSGGSCNTGTQMCCNTVGRHTDPTVVSGIHQSGILGLDLNRLTGDIALGCTLAVQCKQQVTCCSNPVPTKGNGLVGFDCSSVL